MVRRGSTVRGPPEGFQTTPVNEGILLITQTTAMGSEGARGCTPGFTGGGTRRPQTGLPQATGRPHLRKSRTRLVVECGERDTVDSARRPRTVGSDKRSPGCLLTRQRQRLLQARYPFSGTDDRRRPRAGGVAETNAALKRPAGEL